MFFRGDNSAERALYNEDYSSAKHERSALRQQYRYLRRHAGLAPVMARSVVWRCFVAGMESQWHLSFRQWVTERGVSV